MRSLFFILTALLTFSSHAKDINLRFWDGTFAYNALSVKTVEGQNHLLEINLTGSTLGLSKQLEGGAPDWTHRDLLRVFIQRSDCEVNQENKIVDCQIEGRKTLNKLRWTINSMFTKTFHGSIDKLRILADGNRVTFKFSIPENEFFTPFNRDIEVEFGVL